MSALAVLPMVWAFAAPVVEERKGPQRVGVDGSSALALTVGLLREAALEPVMVPEAAPASVFKSQTVLPVQLAFYRKYTEALLRRYLRLSLEAGRTPSLLGRELFRAKVTSYRVKSFEDVVIFVHDVGQCLEKLDREQQHVIRRIALQEYTQGETAEMAGLSLRSVHRRYAEALDKLTGLFIDRGLMEPSIGCERRVG